MSQPTPHTTVPAPPPRPDDSHKGTFGTVIVVGGSPAMIGAPAIAARAALRSGAGLCKVACPGSILPHVLTIEPSATGIILTDPRNTPRKQAQPDADPIAQADPDEKAVLAVGPGLGGLPEVWPLIEPLLGSARPLVLDADGLNALASSQHALERDAATVLTPHPGEYKRLAEAAGIDLDPTDPAQRPEAAAALARHHRAVVLLKGRHTVVSDGDRCYENQTGNPALATAGSGDVLTGVTAALLAAGMDAFAAACLAAYVHGRAADDWCVAHGRSGLRALELADGLPDVFAALRQGSSSS